MVLKWLKYTGKCQMVLQRLKYTGNAMTQLPYRQS